MPETVRYLESEYGAALRLSFPLKLVRLHPGWKPALKLLSEAGTFIDLEQILASVDSVGAVRAESFLNELVCRGFLQRDGISHCSIYPLVSIIIPVRNRPEEIALCLASLLKVEYPRDRMEIIVVDDASNDATPEVISSFPVTLIPLRERCQASFCRNLGAARAKGSLLAFIDSDCVADPSWLKELTPAFNDPSLGAVGGMVDAYYHEKRLEKYEKVKSSLKVSGSHKQSNEKDRFFYVPSCNLLVRRDLFLKLGGFMEDLHVGEDVDLCWRIEDNSYRIEYRPVGRVYHKHRVTMWAFASRRFDYGTSEPILQRLHGERVKQLPFPPGAVLFWCTTSLAVFLGSPALAGLICASIMLDSIGRAAGLQKKGFRIGPLRVLGAVLRGHLAFVHHCCAFISRYYLVWAILALPVLPLASAAILCMHLLTGLVELLMKKPRLNPLAFLLFFTIEQISYQLGVWWSCIRSSCFSPVNPRIVLMPDTGARSSARRYQ